MSVRRIGNLRRQASVDQPRYPPINNSTTSQIIPAETAIQPPLVSDYESDNLGYTSDFPARPPPVNRTKEELNLSVVQRHNPEVTIIHSVAPYATIYDFASNPEPGWQKSGVVGTLFICELTPGIFNEQRYHAIILNRSGLDNFEAELRQTDEGGVEIMDEYVIITREENGESKVNGIYIYSEGEGTSTAAARSANAELMKQLAIVASRSRAAAEAQTLSPITVVPQQQEPHIQPEIWRGPAASISPPRSRPAADLLALFQGGAGAASGTRTSLAQQPVQNHHSYTQPTPPASPAHVPAHAPGQGNVLLNLFRGAGLA